MRYPFNEYRITGIGKDGYIVVCPHIFFLIVKVIVKVSWII